ncbi:MAG: hypothetical protein H6907_11445 [Hyphomicrobiales bacterium]|nr:hypothetical protein [Hyphomicrobiales bacterium]MCP5372336.1 hypothetical protein [Hyphomicrobiales bacterium]
MAGLFKSPSSPPPLPAPDPGPDPAEEERRLRLEELERRRRGRGGTIHTSPRGVLGLNDLEPYRKSLLGE